MPAKIKFHNFFRFERLVVRFKHVCTITISFPPAKTHRHDRVQRRQHAFWSKSTSTKHLPYAHRRFRKTPKKKVLARVLFRKIESQSSQERRMRESQQTGMLLKCHHVLYSRHQTTSRSLSLSLSRARAPGKLLTTFRLSTVVRWIGKASLLLSLAHHALYPSVASDGGENAWSFLIEKLGFPFLTCQVRCHCGGDPSGCPFRLRTDVNVCWIARSCGNNKN